MHVAIAYGYVVKILNAATGAAEYSTSQMTAGAFIDNHTLLHIMRSSRPDRLWHEVWKSDLITSTTEHLTTITPDEDGGSREMAIARNGKTLLFVVGNKLINLALPSLQSTVITQSKSFPVAVLASGDLVFARNSQSQPGVLISGIDDQIKTNYLSKAGGTLAADVSPDERF